MVILCGVFYSGVLISASSVVDTVHNLSVSGPGELKSQTADQVCVFCHTPHRPQLGRGLWNRRIPSNMTSYRSSTTDATPGEVSGPSALCMSCHDGTIALGEMLRSPRRGGSADVRNTHISGRSSFGTNLSNHHPIGFDYDSALRSSDRDLKRSASIDLPLRDGKMHCTSCHDPHVSDNPPFLLKSSANGELCIS